ncbi:hypothetical protein [Kroppenstedtia sanguinis]|uniref:hypothetical protein n=1 Tax=Kroppenstedtia sanguinis TaxID=1380684 RepID=UPI0036D2EC94
MDGIRLWMRVIVVWGLAGFAALLMPMGSRSVPSYWEYINLETLFAAGLILLAGRQVIKVSAKSLSYFLYLPLPISSPVRWRFLLPLAVAWGAAPLLTLHIPVVGWVTLLFFAGREAISWREKQLALRETFRQSS